MKQRLALLGPAPRRAPLAQEAAAAARAQAEAAVIEGRERGGGCSSSCMRGQEPVLSRGATVMEGTGGGGGSTGEEPGVRVQGPRFAGRCR
jgi:hypothetical protein